MSCLFVYGTLAPGRPNAHVLERIGGTWEPAVVKGYLHEEGWGAVLGYPAIILDERGDDVHGFLFVSDNLMEHWPALDALEGEEYERVLSKARRPDGSFAETYIYVLREP